MRLGIIGLGLVGKAMAARLVDGGHAVCGFDIAAAARNTAQEIGVDVLSSARAVAEQVDLVFLSLMTSDDRRNLLWGEQAVAEILRPATVMLDTTTARPQDTVLDHARLAEQDVRLVDVCLAGSSQDVAKGQALALVGDTKENASYAAVLEAFSKAQYYFDEPGQGNRAKLIVNLVLGLNRLVLAEGLGLAAKGGFDLEQILDVLKAGGAYSAVMDSKGPKMLSGVYKPAAARLAQHAKDVGLILEYAQETGAEAPLSKVHAGLIQALVDAGFGDLDNAAIFKAFS